MMRYERNHFTSFLQIWILQLKSWVFPLFFMMVSGGKDGAISLLLRFSILGGFLLLLAIYAVVRWSKRGFRLEEGMLYLRDGVFVRKTREVPLSTISTINLSRSLTQRLFGTTELKLDTGHAVGNNTEISLVLSSKRAQEVQSELSAAPQKGEHLSEDEFHSAQGMPSVPKVVQLGSIQNGTLIHAVKPGSLLLAGLTSNAVLAGIAVFFSFYNLMDDLQNLLFPNLTEQLLSGAESLFSNQFFFWRIAQTILMLIGVYAVISSLAAAIGFLIRWYGFRIHKTDRHLIITYGLLQLKQYKLPLDRIQVVHLRQTPLRRIFSSCSLHVESVGYGNEKGEANLLVPYLRTADAKELMGNLVAGFNGQLALERPPKRSWRRYLVRASILPIFVAIPTTFLLSWGGWFWLLLPIGLISGTIAYHTTGFGYDESVVCLKSGGFWSQTTWVRHKGIQSISRNMNPFLRKAHLASVVVGYRGSTMGLSASAAYLEEADVEKLMSLVRFTALPQSKRNAAFQTESHLR